MNEGFKVKVEVILTHRGEEVLNSKLAQVLFLIDKLGSLLSACKSLGLPYSRVWEHISRVERMLGVKLVEAKRGGRGGGGTRLTDYGKALLRKYYSVVERIRPQIEFLGEVPIVEQLSHARLTVIGSHDPLLEYLIGLSRLRGVDDIEAYWTGSLGGLASMVLGEADIAGIHLYDPERKCYNKPYIERFLLRGQVVLIEGYLRELVFAFRPGLKFTSLSDLIAELSDGMLSIANRNRGSGTRLYLEYLLREWGINSSSIKGFETEFKTHFDTVREVAMGRADFCLTLKYLAQMYKLNYVHVAWEEFDYVVPVNRVNKREVEVFLEVLRGSSKLIEGFAGYRCTSSIGEVKFK